MRSRFETTLLECFLQCVEPQQRALDAHGELAHTLERPQVAETTISGRRLVAVHQADESIGEVIGLRQGSALELDSHHGHGRL